MTSALVTRAQALRHSPALPKVLFVFAVDALTSIVMIVLEKVSELRASDEGET